MKLTMNNVLIAALPLLTGCSLQSILIPQSQGEMSSGYTYVPIDPITVRTRPGGSCPADSQAEGDGEVNLNISELRQDIPYRPLLEALPDNAIRMSVEKFDRSGSLSYGPAGLGARDERYTVTLDYINADTTSVQLYIEKFATTTYSSGEYESNVTYSVPFSRKLPDEFDPNSVEYTVVRSIDEDETEPESESESELLTTSNVVPIDLPVYIGIGLRVTATVEVLGSEVNISGLGAIGAEAESENLKGSLVVQTLGVNGRSISAALPIGSELNRTTVQNAVVAIGSIKSLLYENETIKSPRVVGLYLPVRGDVALVNAIISALNTEDIIWHRPCESEDQDSVI